MELRELSQEVLVADGSLVRLGTEDVESLKRRARGNRRGRIRICTHPNTADRLHEMLIVHTAGVYVPPHKHLGKSESAHVLEGEADVVFFDDDGGLSDVVGLGPHGSPRSFYYRLAEPVFHTLVIRSPFFVMHEVTNGPFRREDTVFAPWAPDESDTDACRAFMNQLDARLPRSTA